MIPGATKLPGGQWVTNMHHPCVCAGNDCCIHNPSDHHMREWPMRYNNPTPDHPGPGLMERLCEHGLGHPDPDHMTWFASVHTTEETRDEATHVCDGCCHE